MNKVILLGRLTKDPDLTFGSSNGIAVCKFTIAVNRQYNREETDFINCIAFRKTAELITQYTSRGKQLCVTGELRNNNYQLQDGTTRYSTNVVVDTFELLGNPNSSNSNNNNANNYNTNGSNYNNSCPFDYDITEMDDGDMPF